VYQPDRIPVFINPRSGSARQVIEALTIPPPPLAVHVVGARRLEAEIRRATAAGVRRVAVAGGDGTVATAASVLAGTPVELAVIPGGTLNHFARDHGIPSVIRDAVTLAATGVATPVDLGAVNDRVFINTSSIGAYVLFVRMRDRLERWFGYRVATVLAALRTMSRLRSFRVAIDVGGEEAKYETPLVFIGVDERALAPPELGGRVPKGRRGLHVMVVGRRDARQWTRAYDRAVRNRGRPAALWPGGLVGTYLVDRCRLELAGPRRQIAADGEVLPAATPLEYRLRREALRVVTTGARG
jgi:diacylglycerol kinase family enzyme